MTDWCVGSPSGEFVADQSVGLDGVFLFSRIESPTISSLLPRLKPVVLVGEGLGGLIGCFVFFLFLLRVSVGVRCGDVTKPDRGVKMICCRDDLHSTEQVFGTY